MPRRRASRISSTRPRPSSPSDLSTWSMAASASRTNMFGEAAKLVELTVGNGVILTNAGIVHPDDVAARWRVEYTDGKFQNREFKMGDFYVTNGTERDPGLLTLYRNSPNTWGIITWHWYPGTIIRWHDNRDSVHTGIAHHRRHGRRLRALRLRVQASQPHRAGRGGLDRRLPARELPSQLVEHVGQPHEGQSRLRVQGRRAAHPHGLASGLRPPSTPTSTRGGRPVRYTFLKFKADGATGGAADIVVDDGCKQGNPRLQQGPDRHRPLLPEGL